MNKACTRWQAIDFLKAIAIFMVLNSHFDSLYPIPAFAAGGAAANSLFFIISGFFCSIRGARRIWAFNKIIKLYLPVWIITCLNCFRTEFPQTLSQFVAKFIWPTDFWFVSALMLFYLIFLILNTIHITDSAKVLSILFLIIYFSFYFAWSIRKGIDIEGSNFKLIYYCYIFLLGTWLKKNYAQITTRATVLFSCGILSFLTSLLFRLLWRKGLIPTSLEFSSQFMNVIFAFAMLIASLKCEALYSLKASTWIKKTTKFLSLISLEIYIVQFDVIHWFKEIKFPVNVIGTIIITIILAFVLNRISLVIKALGKRFYIAITNQ